MIQYLVWVPYLPDSTWNFNFFQNPIFLLKLFLLTEEFNNLYPCDRSSFVLLIELLLVILKTSFFKISYSKYNSFRSFCPLMTHFTFLLLLFFPPECDRCFTCSFWKPFSGNKSLIDFMTSFLAEIFLNRSLYSLCSMAFLAKSLYFFTIFVAQLFKEIEGGVDLQSYLKHHVFLFILEKHILH